MSSGTKVYKYRCASCEREVELVTDNRRADPARCVITDKCMGFLQPLSTRRGDRARLTPPKAGIVDKIERGVRPIAQDEVNAPAMVTMSTFSQLNGLALLGPIRKPEPLRTRFVARTVEGGEHDLELLSPANVYPVLSSIDIMVYEVTSDVLAAQTYLYSFNGIAQVLQGVDSSKEQRLLRFGPTDNVQVMVNGIKLDPSEFDRARPDIIRLTPGVVGSEVTVEVHVYKDRTRLIGEAKQIPLTCRALSPVDAAALQLRSGNAWGDTLRLTAPDGYERSVLFCTDMTKLEERKTYAVARFIGVTPEGFRRELDPVGMWLLLSDAPHSFVDKRLDQVINGATLVSEKFSFTHDLSEATGTQVPVAAETALTRLPLRLDPQPEVRVKAATQDGAPRAYTKRSESYIIGPA